MTWIFLLKIIGWFVFLLGWKLVSLYNNVVSYSQHNFDDPSVLISMKYSSRYSTKGKDIL